MLLLDLITNNTRTLTPILLFAHLQYTPEIHDAGTRVLSLIGSNSNIKQGQHSLGLISKNTRTLTPNLLFSDRQYTPEINDAGRGIHVNRKFLFSLLQWIA